MKKIGPLCLLVIILITSLLLISSVEGSAGWWDKLGKPEYGGTIIHRTNQLVGLNIDPYDPGFQNKQRYFFEGLFLPNWARDREEWPFKTMWIPMESFTGGLAESWEQTDPVTITMKIRQGVHWQDKAPVNGREFTAKDVEFNFHRNLGLGSGWTVGSPLFTNNFSNVKSVAATDKSTVVIKLKKPSALFMDMLLNNGFDMVAPEWVDLAGPPPIGPPAGGGPPGGGPGGPPKGGPEGPPGDKAGGPPGGGPGGPPGGPKGGGVQDALEDWHNAVGTGAWILKDFIEGSSMTFVKNPNYWGHDERHPENQLPYADTLRELSIDDWATTMAAMRTGKIDIIADKEGPSWQQVKSVLQTNPDLQTVWWPMDGFTVLIKYGAEPFNDIRVRKALQMALDIPAIAKSHYGGYVEGKPAGQMNPTYKGWTIPFDEWPADLKEEYSYNPERAKELLAEAGFPNGFKTNCKTAAQWDMDLLQIIKSQFMDIGVDMEIEAMEFFAWIGIAMEGNFDQFTYANQCGMSGLPSVNVASFVPGERVNHGFVDDPKYNEMYKQLMTTDSIEEAKKLTTEMDMYALRQHWVVEICPIVAAGMWQPWIKGLSGEFLQPSNMYFTRMWVDQKLKKSKGH